jgi:plasmid maintenance system antidote protein VapI
MDRCRGSALLREWMDGRGLKQEGAAALLGTRQSNVSAWLRGSRPSLSWALKLRADAGVPVESWVQPDDGKAA